MSNTTTAKKAVSLTTIDNPYNPIDDFDSWFAFEAENGYNTFGYWARFARTSDLLSDEENDEEAERSIQEAIDSDPICLYRRIEEGEKPNPKMIEIYKQVMNSFEKSV